MPASKKLKVYRAPIGFHDVYVAAPSMKAALNAWGSDHDLFARGIAEQVEDPELMREPLEKPGEIIRRLRGTAAEQIASLPKARSKPRNEPPSTPPAVAAAKKASPPDRTKKPKPRPDRAPLREAERALKSAQQRHDSERKELARREAELRSERGKLEQRQAREIASLARDSERARGQYNHAIQKWEG